MTTTSGINASPTVSTGNATDVSSLLAGSFGVSLSQEIVAKVTPYLNQASTIATEINTNNTKIAAYQSMQSLLQSLQTATANLATEPLLGANIFQSRTAGLSSNTSTAASSILSATIAPSTTLGTHSVIVSQIAAAESDTSATLALSSSATLSSLAGFPASATVTIAESGKASPATVTLTSSMTLSAAAAAINNATATNGVTASVVQVDSSHSVLVLSASDTNTPLTFTDSGGALTTLGVVSATLTGSTSPTASAGSFTVTDGTGTTGTVTVTAGESLANIASAINTAAGGTNISASVVSNALQITTTTAGAHLSFGSITGSALSSLGFASDGAAHQATAPAAALLTVDGVSGITRNSNSINDVLSGVTLNLAQASPSTTVTLQVNPDTNGASTAINNFVTAYNSWETFVSQNEATTTSGGAAAGAVLFGDSNLRDASLQIDTGLTAIINNTSLGAIGISLNQANQLTVNSATLTQQLSTNFTNVANFFQSTLTSSSSNLQPSSFNVSNFAGSFSLAITASGGNVTGLTVNGGSANGLFTFSGNQITGAAGSVYAGMFFTYTGTGETLTVTSTSGAANQVYRAATNYGDPFVGQLQTQITNLQGQNQNLTGQYNNWVTEANNYTNFLLTQYSALSSQIEKSGLTSQTLNALFTAQYGGKA